MKCLICKEKTDSKILCSKHLGVDTRLPYLSTHICNSFMQKDGEMEGVCTNYLLCAPIKKALKHEMLVNASLGHVICPHASINLSKIIYSAFSEEEIRANYPEYL